MAERQFFGAELECVRGDIASQPDIDAVVNAANPELRIGGGVAGALHSAAGPGLEQECRALAPIQPGQAVITGAHNLPNRKVIHCLGPVFGVDRPGERLLAACYRNALEAAAHVALATVLEEIPSLSSVGRIGFVLFDDVSHQLHQRILDQLLTPQARRFR